MKCHIKGGIDLGKPIIRCEFRMGLYPNLKYDNRMNEWLTAKRINVKNDLIYDSNLELVTG